MRHLLLFCLLSCISATISAETSPPAELSGKIVHQEETLPTVAEIKLHVEIILSNRLSPGATLLLERDPATRWQIRFTEWRLKHLEALEALVHGNIAKFHDKLRIVEEGEEFLLGGSYSELTCKLYSWAVEAGLSSVDTIKFAKAIRAYDVDDKIGRRRYGRTEPNINRSDWRVMRAHYYYLTADIDGLTSLIGMRVKSDDELEGLFVDGYVEILIAKREKSLEYATLAAEHLRQIMDGFEPTDHGVKLGRVALHLGDAYLILATYSKGVERDNYIERTVALARLARSNLDLIDTPLMWGVAQALTADALDLAFEGHSADTEMKRRARQLIGFRRDRARELSAQYH